MRALKPGILLILVLAAVGVLVSCTTQFHPCEPPPATRPAHSLTPDRYVSVVGPVAARVWLAGESQRRPATIELSDHDVVSVDGATQVYGRRCAKVDVCPLFVAFRPRSRFATALHLLSTRRGQKELAGPIWSVGGASVTMSSGLRLELAPGTHIRMSDAEVRALGVWGAVGVDALGHVTKITQTVVCR